MLEPFTGKTTGCSSPAADSSFPSAVVAAVSCVGEVVVALVDVVATDEMVAAAAVVAMTTGAEMIVAHPGVAMTTGDALPVAC